MRKIDINKVIAKIEHMAFKSTCNASWEAAYDRGLESAIKIFKDNIIEEPGKKDKIDILIDKADKILSSFPCINRS